MSQCLSHHMVRECAGGYTKNATKREVRLLSELSHPGIVRYVAHGETLAGEPFLAMELLAGEDLSHRLARGVLTLRDALGLVRCIAEALASAHAQQVIHRDLKPSNLFLVAGEIESVKILDFGIARARLHTQNLTEAGAVLGTIGYMAPEQACGDGELDARADIFALGCVLFECLTGQRVFPGKNALAVLAKIHAEPPPRVSAVRPELGARVDALLLQMLAKQPEHRLGSAQALLEALNDMDAPV